MHLPEMLINNEKMMPPPFVAIFSARAQKNPLMIDDQGIQ